ncbi:unnamed protein product [Nippostrongylus brasiliensis]|uniref:CpcD-like domain-containing protein n=1 Tax=Nippostrongylus brasiliensis TaxID=27835 RepID=A0A0N4Y1A2_NIPBR|nr:unnamed protein product [Nippostrongylus brasiliensis]
MAEGGLLEGMVTFNADYTAPKLTIAEGTIVYECVEVTTTTKSTTTTTTSASEPSMTTGTSTSESSTTTGTSTSESSTATDPNQNLLRAKRAAGDVDQVQSIPYHIVASITVETMVPIAESQWKTYAEKIQSRLEQRHIVFVDDIEVQML